MQKKISIRLLPSEAADQHTVITALAHAAGVKPEQITGHHIIRQSIDARGRTTWLQLTFNVFIDEPPQPLKLTPLKLQNVQNARHTVIVVGAGPAGLFAAMRLIEHGIRPIIIERGKDIRSRRRDLAAINKQGEVNPESNYCFGEGGAGTYSDGKLYTRSTKRGDVYRILSALIHFGADQKIIYEAHPHIGTNKLPQIITAMREKIMECGGEVLFEKKLVDFHIQNNHIKSIATADGDTFSADAYLLATGHSARDIFQLLYAKGIHIESKPFALGVRVEHPQNLIDSIQYHLGSSMIYGALHIPPLGARGLLPPASYSLVQQVRGKGVFSFCMCPGGIIAPAATNKNEVVVNGWSPSKRNNPYANSGIVVTVGEELISQFAEHGPLAGMYFQQSVEERAYKAGGGKLQAPAQRLIDFTEGRTSTDLPDCSYLPGITSADLKDVLPVEIHRALQDAFREFGKKMRGYYTNDAVVVATESRTSSPVRIPRTEALHHPQLSNFYPCGEGAGYAGGIVSAAMDGERLADAIALQKGS